MAYPSWTTLAYDVASRAADPKISRVVRQLPALLGRGASALEIARKTNVPPGDVDSFLNELAAYHVVESQPSGTTVPYANNIYYVSSEGIQFFRHLDAVLASSSSGR